MIDDLTKEQLLDEYNAEYYAVRISSIPYERSAHWINFFSIAADQLIRALQPRRVLDAGCAMGFLVEAFWDRGVYCEGIDISEFAISQVRRDIKPYCSVGSLDNPIPGRYDLITCIEVLEHLPPDIVRPAVANLCAAADTLLISSTPSELDEPTHYSVHPPIFWLQLFSEFDFWPDARFDASFLTPHAMVLRKGARPPDDLLRLFSEYIRFKTAFEVRANEVRTLGAEVNELRQSVESLQAKEAEMIQNQAALASLQLQLTQLSGQRQTERRNAELDRGRLEQKFNRVATERDDLHAEVNRLLLSAKNLEEQKADLHRQVIEQDVARHQLFLQVQTLSRENNQANVMLHSVFTSRAWRVAEQFRKPMRKLHRDFPRVHRVIRFMARKVVGGRQPQTSGAAGTEQPSEPAGPAHALSATSPQQDLLRDSPAALSSDYQRWICEQEPSLAELQRQRDSASSWLGPTFSVIIPIHQTDYFMLQACVQSVLEQTYPRWELCAAITPGGDPKNHELLSEWAERDVRIKVTSLASNGGISNNSNAALDLASGEFIVLLDHDDTLAPFALFEVATRLQSGSAADILYSDHDYLDPEQSLRCNPLFKPDWSPEIMFSANYITHLTVLRRSLVDQAGRFDPATDGAQDWDLFLRASERIKNISHISKILYHWRMHTASTARNDSAKNYAATAQLLAIQRHMDRLGMHAEPEVLENGLLHARFHQPPSGLVSIIIPTKDKVDLLERCISTLLALTQYEHFEILIVDTGSKEAATREYFETLSGKSGIRVLWRPGSFNYSAVNNRAAREAKGDFLLFLNNDVEITHAEWLTELVCWANLPAVGIVGARLLRPDGSLQHAGVVLGMSGFADHPFTDEPPLTFGMAGSTGWYRDYLAVTGACMLMRREVFDEIGGFDEQFILCGSDVEICLRAHQSGYRVIFNPFSELIHHERQTRGTDIPPSDFVESFKHYSRWLIKGDPYWNSNLSLWNHRASFRYQSEQASLQFAQSIADDARAKSGSTNLLRPSSDEELMVEWFDCTQQQFQDLREQNQVLRGTHAVKRLLWFIPAFEVPFYGGIYTILRFCELWSGIHNVEIFFGVCGASDHLTIVSLIRQVFRDVQPDHVIALDTIQQAASLPDVDASICTLWTTPYYALLHPHVGRRFYLIQDFEPAFYRAGSISALAESTYRMGLYGIANTVSLKKMYEEEYAGKAIHFTPRINSSVFYCAESLPTSSSGRPLQVFFYGRPKHARNAFELVKQAMVYLKARLGGQIRIVSAGDEWKPSEYGLDGIVENLGILAYEDTARLYRESEVGVVMMLTRHPSYIPLELMASGCLTVTNVSSWTSWLLKDGENCLLSPATSSAIADTVELGLTNSDLRQSIRTNALELVRSEYLDWSSQAQTVYQYLCDPEAMLGNLSDAENRKAAAS